MILDPIVHEYTPADESEREKLEDLAAARIRVSTYTNIDQPHLSGLLLRFIKDETVQKVMFTLLDRAGKEEDIVELEKPFQEKIVAGLDRVGEIDIPEEKDCLYWYQVEDWLRENGCELEDEDPEKYLVKITNTRDTPIVIVRPNGTTLEIPGGAARSGVDTSQIVEFR